MILDTSEEYAIEYRTELQIFNNTIVSCLFLVGAGTFAKYLCTNINTPFIKYRSTYFCGFFFHK